MDGLNGIRARAAAYARHPWGRRALRVLRAAFVVGVVAWLAYQLTGIGWAEVWAARPRTPWFYVIWLVLYLQLPVVEGFIYRAVWGLPLRDGLPPILRKRALNQDVVSYSGEAYFFVWARQRLGLPDRMIAGTLKDNAIASSLGSWAAAILLISVFLATGQIVLVDLIGEPDVLYVALAVAVVAALAVVGVRFRKTIFTLPPRAVGGLFLTHVGRFVLIAYTLQIVQWWVVVPEAPLSVWATMLAVMTLVNRLPLIPAKDLVGIGAILGMTDLLAASATVIAAMLLTRSVLDKALNLLLFAVAFAADRRGEHVPAPSGAAQEGEGAPRGQCDHDERGPDGDDHLQRRQVRREGEGRVQEQQR